VRGQLTIGERYFNMARSNGLHLNEAYLKKRYTMDKKPIEEIAKECGVSIQIIYRQLKKFGLKK
jgi:transcriptional regulator of acetoin/glycerol metabolism